MAALGPLAVTKQVATTYLLVFSFYRGDKRRGEKERRQQKKKNKQKQKVAQKKTREKKKEDRGQSFARILWHLS